MAVGYVGEFRTAEKSEKNQDSRRPRALLCCGLLHMGPRDVLSGEEWLGRLGDVVNKTRNWNGMENVNNTERNC